MPNYVFILIVDFFNSLFCILNNVIQFTLNIAILNVSCEMIFDFILNNVTQFTLYIAILIVSCEMIFDCILNNVIQFGIHNEYGYME